MTAKRGHRLGMRGFVGLAVVLMFVVASQQVAATWKLAAIVGSKTEVYNVGATTHCHADTWVILIPAVLHVGNGASVTVWDNASWWDNRTIANAPLAYHNFTLDVDYRGTTYPDSYRTTTRSRQSGTYTLNVTVDVLPNNYLFINWSATVNVPSVSCYDSSTHPMQKMYLGT